MHVYLHNAYDFGLKGRYLGTHTVRELKGMEGIGFVESKAE